MIKELSQPHIQEFIREHANDDPYQISLKYKEIGGIPSKYLSDQIIARKKARKKLSNWYSKQGIVYPSPLSVEQASSETTADFKRQIFAGNHIVDLTGGLGVDSISIAQDAGQVEYVEKDPFITGCARHNMEIHGISNVHIHEIEAKTYLKNLTGRVDGIYIDPSRRKDREKRVYLFEDCDPAVVLLQDQMLEKASRILIKASPMIDITYGLTVLKNVIQVYVVAVKNEVKEILFLSGNERIGEALIEGVNISSTGQENFRFKKQDESGVKVEFSEPLSYLYEPNVAILKAGGFNTFANRYRLKKLHRHSHLYTSLELIDKIPGRTFRIRKTEPFKGGKQLIEIERANITTRNFRLSADEIKKRYGISDGGEDYLFFTTNISGDPIIIHVEKI